MITINVSDNIKDVIAGMDDVARRQVPFATAQALTRTAKSVQGALERELVSVFDRPTPWVARGTFVAPATKQNLTAETGMKDKGNRTPARYTQEHFSGGTRGLKAFELVMQQRGILPQGMRAIPGAGIKADRYGNPNRAAIKEVIEQASRGVRVWTGKGKRQSLTGYFVVTKPEQDPRTKHLIPGIYRRIQKGADNALIPVFVFVDQAQYGKVIDLQAIASKTVRAVFEREFAAALKRAMETAR